MLRNVLVTLTMASGLQSTLLEAQDTAHVVVVATTDVHARATSWDYVNDRQAPWGLSRVATVVDSLRNRYPGEVVVLDAGDLIQGSPFATYFATVQPTDPDPVIDAMNAVGYDAVTPGNHEFNFGLEVLARAYRAAAFPIVSANIFRLPRDTFAYLPYVTLARGGVQIGVTAFTTPGTMVWDRRHLAGRLLVRPILERAPQALASLRSAGADLLVVLSHSGLGGVSSYDTTGVGKEDVSAQLSALAVKPDLVVVGHSHRQITDTVIDGVHFVQPRAHSRGVAVVHVWMVRGDSEEEEEARETAQYRVVRIVGEEVPLADVLPSASMERRLSQAHEQARTWASAPLATVEGDWSARFARVEDTPLIDFINQVQREVAGTQLSSTAAFNISGGFGPGAVLLRDLAGVYPYENTLKAVLIDGARLREYLEHSARYFSGIDGGPVNDSIPGYNYDIVSGVEYAVDLTRPVGSRIRQLTYQGRLVSASDTFSLALNNYRQAGGGNFTMLAGLPVIYDRGESIRDLLADAVRDADVLLADTYVDHSWRLIPESARETVRGVFAPPRAPPVDRTVLRVLATTDLHGALQPKVEAWSAGRRVGGMAAIAGLMDSLEALCDCATLRVDVGDQWQGTPISNFVYGRSVVEVFNQVGYDVAALGNHEFDWGVDTLLARLRQAEYPWLAANVSYANGRGPPNWTLPWTLIEQRGVRVAFIGVITASTSTSADPAKVRDLAFSDGASTIQRFLPAVRGALPDFVVVLAHAGGRCDSVCEGEVIDLARGLDSAGVDLIVAGHTHTALDTVINGIPIVQAQSSGTALAVVDFVRRADGGREVNGRVATIWTDSIQPDTAVAEIVDRFAAGTDAIANRPITNMRFALSRERDGEYALGHLVADALRNAARAEIGLMNNSGIRDDLPVGSVTYGDLVEVVPWGNQVVRLTLPGSAILEALEYSLERERPGVHISGMTVQYDTRREVGRRVREARLDDGRKIDRDKDYTLALPDFLANGGSGFAMFGDHTVELVGVTDLQALVQYLQRLPPPVEVSERSRFVVRR